MDHLNYNVPFPGACAVQFTVFFNHNNLPFLFHLLHVLLHLVEDAAVVLLGYTHKLDKTGQNNKHNLRTDDYSARSNVFRYIFCFVPVKSWCQGLVIVKVELNWSQLRSADSLDSYKTTESDKVSSWWFKYQKHFSAKKQDANNSILCHISMNLFVQRKKWVTTGFAVLTCQGSCSAFQTTGDQSSLTFITKTLPGSRPPWSSWHPSCIPSPWLATLQNCSPCTGSLSGPQGTSPPPNRLGSLTMNPAEPKNKSEADQWITKVKLPSAHLIESFYQTDSCPKTKRGCCNKRFQREIQ